MTTTARRPWRLVALLSTLAVLAVACGSDDDTTATSDDTAGASSSTAGDGGAGASTAGASVDLDAELEVAEGTVLPLPDCPSDWDPMTGLTDDTIKLATSLPESGPAAALGGIDDGMRAWFDHMEPIDGRTIELVSADDGYDPARTLSNVDEIIATEDPFALAGVVGTPPNLAIRDLTDDECVPQVLNGSGFPAWGDPAEYPWTIGAILSYSTEAILWCNYIAEEIGVGTTVAGLFLDNDFGIAYRDEIEACADEGKIDLVEAVSVDPTAPDVSDEITTLAGSGAEVVVLGTSGASCPQSMAALAALTTFNPTIFMSYTCQSIPTYFKPIDPAGEGVIIATTSKEAGDADDPAVQEAITALEAAGLDPFAGSYFSGVQYGKAVEVLFRQAAAYEGGLDRVNLMRAAWNADTLSPFDLEGATRKTDGVNDAYLVESAQFARYVPPAAGEELGRYEPIGDLVNLEGETGSVGQD